MDKKRKILTLAIAIFMVLSFSLTTSKTFAYWAMVASTTTHSTPMLTTGSWPQVFEWDPNATYLEGDLVTNNGVIYEAKRDNPTREPGVDKGWNRDWS